MDDPQNQGHEPGRPGHRKEFRRIDKEIWLWACGKTVTKREVKEYAKEAFDKGGFPSFKASDGWYRRWQGRWKRSEDTLKLDTVKEEKTVTPPKRLTNLPLRENSPSTSLLDSKKCSPFDFVEETENFDFSSDPQKADAKDIDKSLQRRNETEDCIEATGLNLIASSKPVVAPKKKIERYLPHFKAKVVSYASKYSIKDAAYNFKVNKSTIADWMREDQKSLTSVDGALKVEFRPDLDFIDWLQKERKSGRLITRDLLNNKFKELSSFEQDLTTKKVLWFYKYMDRFSDKNCTNKTHIMYPSTFRRELAKMCSKWSKKTVGRVFNVDRKRIANWVQRYETDNCAQPERKVSCYLTDDKIDTELWDWYSTKRTKPNSKQIRNKAVEMYRQAGYSTIRCSSGWYYRWRKRYMLPSSSLEKKEFDEQLVEWILGRFDDNKSVSHAELIAQATSIKGGGLKLSSSWIVRFLKRYSPFLQKRPNFFVKLPSALECKVSEFKDELLSVFEEHCMDADRLIAFDEVPLNFSMSGVQKSACLLRKSGFDHCHASLILVCSASGVLHPTTLILKAPEDDNDEELKSCVTVTNQAQGIVDSHLLSNWFANLLQSHKSSVFICDSFSPHKKLHITHGELLNALGSKLMLIPDGCSSRLLPIVFGISDEFKKMINAHWEKWLQDICWNVGNGVKLPASADIKNWVLQAHQKSCHELQDTIKECFSKILCRP